MHTIFQPVQYAKKYNNFGIVDHPLTKKSLYTTKEIQKGAIELYFGEAVEQPLFETRQLMVGRTYEEAEYNALSKEKRKRREAYIATFNRCIYTDTTNPQKLSHTNIYDVSCKAPAIASGYIKKYLTSDTLNVQERGDVVLHHEVFGTIVFTHNPTTSTTKYIAPVSARTPCQEATYWILRMYSEKNYRPEIGGFKTAVDGTTVLKNTIPISWNPTDGNEATFYSSLTAKCSILQQLNYYVFDHALFYHERGNITINRPSPVNDRILYVMSSASDGYTAFANMEKKTLFISRKRPQQHTDDIEQDFLTLLNQFHNNKEAWTITYGNAAEYEQFVRTSKTKHLHFLVHDKQYFPTDVSLFFFAKSFGGEIKEKLKLYRKSDYQRIAVLHSNVARYKSTKNVDTNVSPVKKRKLGKELLVPSQCVYFKNKKNVMEHLGYNLGWGQLYGSWLLEIPTIQPVEIEIYTTTKKTLTRNQLMDAREETGYCVGDRVNAYFKDDEKWYEATIVTVATTTVEVMWKDGDTKHTTHPVQGDYKPVVTEKYNIPSASYDLAIPLFAATNDTKTDVALKKREKINNLYTKGVVDPLFVGSKDGTSDDALDGLTPLQFFQATKVDHPVLSCMVNEPIEHTHANMMLSPYEDDLKFCDASVCVHTDKNQDVRCYPRFYAMLNIPSDTPLTWVYSDGENPLYKIGYLPPINNPATEILVESKKHYVSYNIGGKNLSVAISKAEVALYEKQVLPLLDTMRFYKTQTRKETSETLSKLFKSWESITPSSTAIRSYRKKEFICILRPADVWDKSGGWKHAIYQYDKNGTRNNVTTYNLWADENRFYPEKGENRNHLGLLVATRNILKGEPIIVSKKK